MQWLSVETRNSLHGNHEAVKSHLQRAHSLKLTQDNLLSRVYTHMLSDKVRVASSHVCIVHELGGQQAARCNYQPFPGSRVIRYNKCMAHLALVQYWVMPTGTASITLQRLCEY